VSACHLSGSGRGGEDGMPEGTGEWGGPETRGEGGSTWRGRGRRPEGRGSAPRVADRSGGDGVGGGEVRTE